MTYPLGLFEGFGIELEYMIVDRDTLAVCPIADEILRQPDGSYESEIEVGDLAWSNELVLHVIELKTNGPRATLEGLSSVFQRGVGQVNAILENHKSCLMPTAMHPWMDPETETRLWPHDQNEVYEAFDRIFDCRGHGWANLQSIHINLPFRDDAEFGRLHAAIRMILPLLPALAASSPFVRSRSTGVRDNRLEFYRGNCRRVPSVTGHVVPERVFTQSDYETILLGGLYRDIAAFDPEGILQHEWLNARGAIARFDRNTIEIRLLDIQECPQADLAVCAAVVGVIRALVGEAFLSYASQREWPEERLEALLLETIREGEDAVLSDVDYVRAMGYPGETPIEAGRLWRHLIEERIESSSALSEWEPAMSRILDDGSLASRILRAVGSEPTAVSLQRVYRSLCACLKGNRMFVPDEAGG